MKRWPLVPALLVSLMSPVAAQERQVVRVPTAPADLPFSAAIRAGGLIFLSGQIGNVPGTRNLVSGGIAAETRQTMENIGAILRAAGTSWSRVVKCTVFLLDIRDYDAMNEVYRSYFPADPPARSTLAASGLALGARVEIECIALP
jgi:2-iminobutanoate/2-iminopropanoate deaminase